MGVSVCVAGKGRWDTGLAALGLRTDWPCAGWGTASQLPRAVIRLYCGTAVLGIDCTGRTASTRRVRQCLRSLSVKLEGSSEVFSRRT
jgi:hypothetical protein